MNKKFLSFILAAILAVFVSLPAFANEGLKINGKDSGAITNVNIKNASSTVSTWFDQSDLSLSVTDPSLFATGTGNGGATSIASTVDAIPTSFAFVRIVVPSNGDAAFTAKTLANGKPGQYLTLYCPGLSPSGATTGGNATITPATSTGFTSIKMSATNDVVTLLYVDDTTGWVIVSQDGTITITLKA